MPVTITEDFWSDTWSDTWPGDTHFVPDPIYTGTRIPRVSLKVNGQDVKAEGMTWDSAEGEGYRGLTATITREDALRLNVVQGANVTLWESAAECHFDGHLTGPPRLRTDGKADITANGWALKAEKRTDPLCYQNRDYSQWQDEQSDPFAGFSTLEDLEAESRDGVLFFRYVNNTAVAGGQNHGLCLWQPGAIMTRYAFSIHKKASTGNFDIRGRRFTGPGAGTATDVAIHGLSAASPTAIAQAVSGTSDALQFTLAANATLTTGSTNVIRLRNVRINARHPDGTAPAGDTWTPRDIGNDICTILGLDSSANLASNTLNILPWWAADGESFLDNLAAATDLSDDHFGFYERGRLVAGPWEDSPIWYVRNGPGVDLTPNVIHPQVQVSYDGPRSKPKRVIVTNATALAKYGENTFEVELPDPQSDAVLANAVANALLPVVSEESHSGIIQTTEYRDASGAIRPFGPRPGHRVCIEDWAPGQSYTARITSTSGAQGEPLTLGVEGDEANADRIILMADKREDRRKRHRKRHRRRKRKKKKN